MIEKKKIEEQWAQYSGDDWPTLEVVPGSNISTQGGVTLKVTSKLPEKDVSLFDDHYKKLGVEPWDVVADWPLEQQIGVFRHGVIKYAMRLGNKDERLQEAIKARNYANKLVEVLTAAKE